MKSQSLTTVIVNTTVQPNGIAHPGLLARNWAKALECAVVSAMLCGARHNLRPIPAQLLALRWALSALTMCGQIGKASPWRAPSTAA